MDGRILSDRRGSVVRLHRRGHGNVANSRNTLAAGEISRSDGATNVAAGSDQHKLLFCRMLLDTFSPYKPESIAWPELDDEARRRLCALPIWDIAVQTEGRACLRVLSYGETVSDPLLQRAIRLNAFEEARHKRLLNCMVSHYGIRLAEEPPYREPRDPEWAFMITGFSECIDSFFAFGLFEACRQSGFFPTALAEAFEPVMQEESRHILFFVNWVAWHRRTLSWWRKPIFVAKVVGVWLFLIWERVRTARDLGGSNFTMTGSESVGIDLSLTELLDLCLAENERRLGRYDPRLLRPRVMPRLATLFLRFAKRRMQSGNET
jgi:hypothetical protein